jgi:hypothetical protein
MKPNTFSQAKSATFRVVRRKAGRQLQAIKYAIKTGQHEANVYMNESSLNIAEQHAVIGHYAALTAAYLRLDTKVEAISRQFHFTYQQRQSVLAHFETHIRKASTLQSQLNCILKRSSRYHRQCDVCVLPASQLLARMRHEANLWDPNFKRRMRFQSPKQTNTDKAPVLNCNNESSALSMTKSASPQIKNPIKTSNILRLSLNVQSSSSVLPNKDAPMDAKSQHKRRNAKKTCSFSSVTFEINVVPQPRWWFHRWRSKAMSQTRSARHIIDTDFAVDFFVHRGEVM